MTLTSTKGYYAGWRQQMASKNQIPQTFIEGMQDSGLPDSQCQYLLVINAGGYL